MYIYMYSLLRDGKREREDIAIQGVVIFRKQQAVHITHFCAYKIVLCQYSERFSEKPAEMRNTCTHLHLSRSCHIHMYTACKGTHLKAMGEYVLKVKSRYLWAGVMSLPLAGNSTVSTTSKSVMRMSRLGLGSMLPI